ncbi:hypothetical protein IV203_018925 [Nitzschia inconspicua]|uniref:Uncharacterized protein n=1 Tax=Nitzschia inconspicua TaxID=303405 RepID=A0A9K3M2K6_9STRA|nr:hypothetical protein IV203_018925 [Nitzschia inconspicua]
MPGWSVAGIDLIPHSTTRLCRKQTGPKLHLLWRKRKPLPRDQKSFSNNKNKGSGRPTTVQKAIYHDVPYLSASPTAWPKARCVVPYVYDRQLVGWSVVLYLERPTGMTQEQMGIVLYQYTQTQRMRQQQQQQQH